MKHEFPGKDQINPHPNTSNTVIPGNIQKVLHQGLSDQTSKGDISFQIDDHYTFPAKGGVYLCFSFRLLGLARMRAYADLIFLRFYTMGNQVAYRLEREISIPAEGALASGDKFYVGYPLLPGKYLIAMAITSSDFVHLGTAYYRVSLPDPLSGPFDISPICFVKKIDYMPTPETKTIIYRDSFAYSVMKIEPKPDRKFSSDENLEVLFWIVGAKPRRFGHGKYKINLHYQVTQNRNPVILWAPSIGETQLVNQTLPLVQTIRIQTSAGDEIRQKRLDSGNYTLVIMATDVATGRAATKEIDFTVQSVE